MPALPNDAPLRLQRFLLPSERLVVAVRRHPVQLVEPIASVVAALVVVLWLASALPAGVPVVLDLAWFGWLAVVGRALWRVLEWNNDWFLVTDRRLVVIHGIFTRKTSMMPMSKVTDMRYIRSPAGRLLGYGQFVLESAGQDQALRVISWLPNPDALYRRICREIFDGDGQPLEPDSEPRRRRVPGWPRRRPVGEERTGSTVAHQQLSPGVELRAVDRRPAE